MELLRLEDADGAPVEALLERPAGASPFPAVLLVHAEDGLDGAAQAWARELAVEGFLVLAPRLLASASVPAPREALTQRRSLATLEAALRQLQGRPEVASARLAVLGLGAGGTLAFQLACTTRRRLAAALDVGGPLLHASLAPERPIQPLELALNLECPLLVLLDAGDPHVPAGHAAEIEARLGQFARAAEVVVLPSGGRGFLGPAASGYDGCAAQAWSRTLSFLREQLS